MICILSQSHLEPTTEAVMSWLRAWDIPFIRLNGSDIDKANGPVLTLNNGDFDIRLQIDGATINLKQIRAVWYRRWAYNNKYRKSPLFTNKSHKIDYNVVATSLHIFRELEGVSNFLFSAADSAEWLGDPVTAAPNKLDVLRAAAKVGLDIPDTIVTTDRDEVRHFSEKHKQIVTKPISDLLLCVFDDSLFITYTAVLTEKLLQEGCWTGAFPSLFQERLKKSYEIRVFYLDGKCYSMAMFTQNESQTQVDFRKYSYSRPARTVPYQLSKTIEDKLCLLMDALHLDTGSIDMIRTVDGRDVFLEVNPVGQFGMVSSPCNYRLERKVAESLVHRLNKARTDDHGVGPVVKTA